MPPFAAKVSSQRILERLAEQQADGLESLIEDSATRLAAAFAEVAKQVLPDGMADDDITVDNLLEQARQASGAIRHALEDMLIRSAALGMHNGALLIRAATSKKTVSAFTEVSWNLANDAVRTWLLGDLAGYVDILSIAVGQTEAQRIRAVTADWVTNRESRQWLVNQIRGSGGPYSETTARLIARTEVTRGYAQGNKEQWASQRVTTVWWRSKEDEMLVCDICREYARNGPYDIRGPVSPPGHPGCRCWLAPHVEIPKRPGDLGESKPIPSVAEFEKALRTGVVSTTRLPKEFATAGEAEDAMMKLHPHIIWDFEGADPAALGRIANKMDDLLQKHPEVGGRLQFVGTFQNEKKVQGALNMSAADHWRNEGSVYAHASINGKFIGFNPKFFGDLPALEKDFERVKEMGWLAVPSVEGITAHEFGHQVEHYYQEFGKDKLVPGLLPTKAGRGTVMGTVNDWTYKARATNETLSEYGMSTVNRSGQPEAWAEAFAKRDCLPPEEWDEYTYQFDRLLTRLGSPSEWKSLNEVESVEQLYNRIGETDYDAYVAAVRGRQQAYRDMFESDLGIPDVMMDGTITFGKRVSK